MNGARRGPRSPFDSIAIVAIGVTIAVSAGCSDTPTCAPPTFVYGNRCAIHCVGSPETSCDPETGVPFDAAVDTGSDTLLDSAPDGSDSGSDGSDAPIIDVVDTRIGPDVQSADVLMCDTGLSACVSGCIDVLADPLNCGGCGHTCARDPNGSPTCTAGSCGTACNASFHLCAGACSDDTSVLSCGASCTPCSAPSGAHATCIASACGFECNPGFVLNAGACELLAPRPIAPAGTAIATSRRPRFVWDLPPGVTGARVELFRDRGCTMPIGSPLDATGTSATPAADLPAGVLFFRLRGLSGGVPGTMTSATWEFTVSPGRAGLASRATWGSVPDVDGDGHPDLLVGSPDSSLVAIYRGGSGSVAPSPTTVSGPASASFGFAVASVGDVDGDGFGDIAISMPDARQVRIYRGTVAGLGGLLGTISTSTATSTFGYSVSGAGDVNGDGYADVLIGDTGSATAEVVLGTATGPSLTATPIAGGTGGVVAGGCDVNADGFADVIVGHAAIERAFVYLGSSAGLSTTPTPLNAPIAGGLFGNSVACAGDVDADGYPDLVVGSTTTSAVQLYRGGASGVSTTPIGIAGPASVRFGYTLAGIGDTDADGFDDLAVSSNTMVFIHRGRSGGVSTTPQSISWGATGTNTLALALTGDADGDGFPDLLVGDRTLGRAILFHGASARLLTPGDMLTPPTGALRFGFSVALSDGVSLATPRVASM